MAKVVINKNISLLRRTQVEEYGDEYDGAHCDSTQRIYVLPLHVCVHCTLCCETLNKQSAVRHKQNDESYIEVKVILSQSVIITKVTRFGSYLRHFGTSVLIASDVKEDSSDFFYLKGFIINRTK